MKQPTIENRQAKHQYTVLETVEVGVVLRGSEVKSVREGRLTLTEAFAQVEKGELFLHNAHIDEYEKANQFNHRSLRMRKLLAHKTEISKLQVQSTQKGHSLIPLKAYFKDSYLKLLLGICQGKDKRDKRQDKAKQEAKIQISRILKSQLK